MTRPLIIEEAVTVLGCLFETENFPVGEDKHSTANSEKTARRIQVRAIRMKF
jgi:hypothetical protein